MVVIAGVALAGIAISIVTAVILGEYLAGALVVLMLSGGEAVEGYAVRSARRFSAHSRGGCPRSPIADGTGTWPMCP